MFEADRPSLDPWIPELAIDACLSASNFGDKRWKLVVIKYADFFANLLKSDVIKCRVHLRKASIARLYNLPSDPSPADMEMPEVDNRSNADFGKLVLLRARLQMEKGLSIVEVNQTLDQFCPWDPISDLEKSVQLDINFLRAKMLRFQGNFVLAKDLLMECMQAVRYRATNMITIHYFETLCEAGHPSQAIDALECEYNEMLNRENGQTGSGRRLRIALGGAYLMKFLLHSDGDSLKRSETLFEKIQWTTERTLITKHNFYVANASLGMIYLLKNEWNRSLHYWNEALKAARNCFPETGHAEMVIHYAQCEILHRLGQAAEAQRKGAVARSLFRKHGREYHFLGQGTAWLDKLNMLANEGGRAAIAGNGQIS